MSEPRAVRFDEADLEPEAPGIASRAIQVGGVRWALVEYEPGILREEWCDAGHTGYVIEGSVTYEFRNGRDPIELKPGDAFTLPDGEDNAHRGTSGPAGARLFIVDRAG